MYDAIESDLPKKGQNQFRFAENEYFADAVCLNKRGKIQANAMKEVIEYSGLPIGYVESSLICRSRQTAEITLRISQKFSFQEFINKFLLFYL